MAKNPVWKCYYNDLRGSTQDWTSEEFGVYVRLLIYQWDKGFIPADEHRRELIAPGAGKHWALIGQKFDLDENGNLVNKKGAEVKETNEKHLARQRDNGLKPKRSQKTSQSEAKNEPLEHEYEIDNEIKERGPGETIKNDGPIGVLIVPELLSIWKAAKPDYIAVPENDFKPLREIALMIRQTIKVDTITEFNHVTEIKNCFKQLVDFIQTDSHFKDYQISQVSKYFNSIRSKAITANTQVLKGKNGKPSIIQNNFSTAEKANEYLERKYADA